MRIRISGQLSRCKANGSKLTTMDQRGNANLESSSTPALRQKWTLTQDAFDRLLVAFDADRESAGKKYLELRGNLIRLFEWRGCPFPEEHADETVNRVARKLGEGELIREPAQYAIGVARMLLLEIRKEQTKQQENCQAWRSLRQAA